MSIIQFDSKISRINDTILIKLPKSASEKLASRGMVMVIGSINGFNFETALEPDGKGSHWFGIDEKFHQGIKADVGQVVHVEIEPTKDWPEPELPTDLKQALRDSPAVNALWLDITPMARWDWIRWIRSTKNPQTRQKRIEVAFSKLKAGSRRPCCFNRTECTDPTLSNKGILLDL